MIVSQSGLLICDWYLMEVLMICVESNGQNLRPSTPVDLRYRCEDGSTCLHFKTYGTTPCRHN